MLDTVLAAYFRQLGDDLNAWGEYLDFRLDILGIQLNTIRKKDIEIMALGQEILDAVAAESTVIDGFIVFVKNLVAQGTVSPAQGQAILAAIASDKQKLEAAILENTPPVTP